MALNTSFTRKKHIQNEMTLKDLKIKIFRIYSMLWLLYACNESCDNKQSTR